ncbi:hypothetical protein PAMP_017682 [Pampus punctatissimus]
MQRWRSHDLSHSTGGLSKGFWSLYERLEKDMRRPAETGAWLGRTCAIRGERDGQREGGNNEERKTFREIKEGHAMPPASPIMLSPLH